MSDKNKKINPSIRTTTIGVRELREIKVYPLSVGEQLKLGDIITDVVVKFVSGLSEATKGESIASQMENVELVEFLIKTVKDNIAKVISLTTDEDGEKLLFDLTNDQFLDFANMVFEMNYAGDNGKKLMALIQNVMGVRMKAEEEVAPPKKAKKKKPKAKKEK